VDFSRSYVYRLGTFVTDYDIETLITQYRALSVWFVDTRGPIFNLDKIFDALVTCEYPRRAAGCTALHRRRHRTTGIETASMSATTSSASLSAVVSINAAHTRGASSRRAARAAPSSVSDRASSMIVRCDKAQGSTSDASASTSAPLRLDRRALFTGAACLTAASSLTLAAPQPARAVFDGSDSKMVGAYLPAGPDGLFSFEARAPRTPALRAGALEPYSILLPPEFKEAPVSNARSGNYCQPRCDEATTEVQFVDSNAGSLQVSLLYHNKSGPLHGQLVC